MGKDKKWNGKNTGRMGFSHAAEDSAENMMAAVKAEKSENI